MKFERKKIKSASVWIDWRSTNHTNNARISFSQLVISFFVFGGTVLIEHQNSGDPVTTRGEQIKHVQFHFPQAWQ